MTASVWVGVGASAIGRDHLKSGTVCQDAFAIRTTGSGEWIAAAVSDGAGTAPRSDKGARLVSDRFASKLHKLAGELSTTPPGSWVNDFIIQSVLDLRRELRDIAGGDTLSDFHCTLVGCLVGPRGGVVVHIGDGFAAGARASLSTSKPVDLGEGWVISNPENGEYANETFFVTEGNWIRHLRITPLSDLDWIVLGTDGGGALAMSGARGPNAAFIRELIEGAVKPLSDDARNETVRQLIVDDRFNALTGDDKTLVMLFRPGRLGAGPYKLTAPEEYQEHHDQKAVWVPYRQGFPPQREASLIAASPEQSEPVGRRAAVEQFLAGGGAWKRAAVFGVVIGLVASLIVAVSIQTFSLVREMVDGKRGAAEIVLPKVPGTPGPQIDVDPRLARDAVTPGDAAEPRDDPPENPDKATEGGGAPVVRKPVSDVDPPLPGDVRESQGKSPADPNQTQGAGGEDER